MGAIFPMLLTFIQRLPISAHALTISMTIAVFRIEYCHFQQFRFKLSLHFSILKVYRIRHSIKQYFFKSSFGSK